MKTAIDADEKNARQNILIVTQGGIALEQKQYYLDTDESTTNIREAYKQNIVKMMQLFGFTEEQATRKMTNILRLETEMAKVSRTLTDEHSLGKWRINGAFPHIDVWYEVYGVKEGDKMYLPKEKRLDLW